MAHNCLILKTEVEKILIPLPSFSEQRRIVEILDAADELRQKRALADCKATGILPALFYKMAFINWRAFSLTMFVILLVSLLCLTRQTRHAVLMR